MLRWIALEKRFRKRETVGNGRKIMGYYSNGVLNMLMFRSSNVVGAL